MSITHAKVSGLSDGADTTLVRPSDWDADHVGGSRVVDLGVILASACSGGNSTDLEPLIGASVGDVVQLVVSSADFVAHDSDAFIHLYPYNDAGSGSVVQWLAADTTPADAWSGAAYGFIPYVENGAALPFVGAGSLATVGAIHLKAVVTSA